ncbi:MAG: hypothetical protein H7Z18_11300 [Methylophilaceae bacterium]|nr:hypothetical protein [Methylophilaceae bacterium]
MNFQSEYFKIFNPLTCYIPQPQPFANLDSILGRAKFLLKGRSLDEIMDAAINMDWVIHENFRCIKEDEISRLQSKQNTDLDEFYNFFMWDGGTRANGRYLFDDSKEGELDIETSENTSVIDALNMCFPLYDDLGGEVFIDGKKYEYFAILAMWQLVESMIWLGVDFERNLSKLITDHSDKVEYREYIIRLIQHFKGRKNIEFAATSAMDATEAICYAEQLFEIQNIQLGLDAKIEIELERKDVKRKSIISEKLNIARHKVRNVAFELVTNEWAKNQNQFLDMVKAGTHYSAWLEPQDFSYEPSTVTSWLRAYAKKMGIKLR